MASSLVKRRALGRGLSALIPGADSGEQRGDYFLAGIEDVMPNPDQPRKDFAENELAELTQSIAKDGILQPLVVREDAAGRFVLIAGERRWRAAQRAGLRQVPVVIRQASPDAAFELALIENLQRSNLNAIEEAEAYEHLCQRFSYTQEELAQRVGKDRTTCANALRLLKLPVRVRAMVREGKLSMGHARALLGLEEPSLIEQGAQLILQKKMSVRQAETWVQNQRRPKKAPAKSASLRDLEERLTQKLLTRVTVTDRGKNTGGKIEITYANWDQLDQILSHLL